MIKFIYNFVVAFYTFLHFPQTKNNLADIHVKIECGPEFANRWEHQIDVIPANQSLILNVHDFRLSSRFLSELTEKITGEIEVTITAGEEVIFRKNYSVDVLAFDQWNGIGILPEMAAAFITPNLHIGNTKIDIRRKIKWLNCYS